MLASTRREGPPLSDGVSAACPSLARRRAQRVMEGVGGSLAEATDSLPEVRVPEKHSRRLLP